VDHYSRPQIVFENNVMGSLFSTPISVKIGIFGHNGVGKTTILYALKGDKNAEIIPTPGFNVEKFHKFGIDFTAWDISGRDHRPSLRRSYYPGTEGMIFVVDSSDIDKLDDALAEFAMMIQDEELKNSVFLLLANKQDLPGALSLDVIRDKIHNVVISQKFRAAAVSATTAPDALEDSVKWLVEQLKSNK
jgi:small GTP-binding protein